MQTQDCDESGAPVRRRTPRLSFYHPNGNGAGAAARFEFRLPSGDREGCFFLEMARQKTLATRQGPERQAATFDWNAKLIVKLAFGDICQLLTVLTGRADQLGGGRGLFHDTAESSTMINLRHQAEPAGYSLEVSRKAKQEGAEPVRMRLLLTEPEAHGLAIVLREALFPMIYGGQVHVVE